MSLRAAVVGLGQIGMGYDLELDRRANVLTHANAFSSHPAFNLVLGVDPSPDRRSQFEQAYGRRAYATIADAGTEDRLDVVAVCGPTHTHASVVREVLERWRPRAILCEKPIAHDIHDGRAIVQACDEAGVALYVNYIRRSDPASIEVRRRIETAEIATPLKGVCWYSKGFIHNGSHFFNLLEYWLGPSRDAVVANPGRLFGGIDPEPDVRVEFERGAIVFVSAREEDYSHYTIELIAPNGRLSYEAGGESVRWQPVIRDPLFAGYTILSPDAETLVSGMLRYQWNVADQLAAVMPPRSSAAQLCTGAAALETLEAMYRITEQR